MAPHIACLVDLNGQSTAALHEAVRLRDERGGRLSVVLVDTTLPCPLVGPEGGVWIPELGEIRAEMREALDVLANDLDADGVLLDGEVAWSVSSWASEAQVDVLVVTERGGRLARALGGSVARRLLRRAPCPVFVVPVHPAAARSLPAPAPVGALA
jgi:nucleotide-binding universal stress UspA family protein